jgi:uncharacterized protein
MTGLQPEDFDALDDILDDLRTRYEETPQWEFCEGFMVALICCRRAIPEVEWLPVLLGLEDEEGEESRVRSRLFSCDFQAIVAIHLSSSS